MNARAALVFACAAPVLAQSHWQFTGGDGTARIAGPTPNVLRGPRASADGLAAGDYAVHFGVDAAGQPASLAFAVPDGASVHLAVERAGPPAARTIAIDGDDWTETTGPDTLRTTGPLTDGDYRVEVTCDPGATEVVGLVARWSGANGFYAFVFDRARGEYRLERHLGPDALVLARAATATALTGPRRLALQVQGFRMQAACDDEIVLQLFDGALSAGAFGVCWRGARPAWSAFTVAPPVAPRASAALVRTEDRTATLRAATNVTPGHWYVLELQIDRPHALLPVDAAGLEPWLASRPAAPRVLLADPRGALGAGTFGEVPPSGTVQVGIEWPELPALRGQVALARLLLVTADGALLSGATPFVPLRL